jgi:twitching motility protein PilT
MEFNEIMLAANAKKASDVHFVIGMPPIVRIDGDILPLEGFPVMSEETVKSLIFGIMTEDQIVRFRARLGLDFSHTISEVVRMRINVFSQRNGVEVALRLIPATIPSPEEIMLTPEILSLTDLPRGLILVTGPTGAGKTTTLATLIDHINSTKCCRHILTIEDPIEYFHHHKKCIVRQRELGTNTHSFSEALRDALRQDPDIIFVGEMRDLETMSLAITAAETGHLVFSSLHTQDAPQTIDRIIDVFPPHQQQQVRTQLATTLKSVICQQLLPRADGKGRVAAREIMIVNIAISNLIREGRIHQISGVIETTAKSGNCTLENSLIQLMRDGLITKEEAIAKANHSIVTRV